MDWIQSFDLFLFDFDGLLVSSEHLHFKAYIEMCRRRGFTLSWDFHRFCLVAHYSSTGLRDSIYSEFPELKAQEPVWNVLYAEKKSIYQELIEKGELELMPGVEPLLKALEQADIRRCVATNSPREQIEAFKKGLPLLQTIPVWITREDYEKAKPEPDAYLKALQVMAKEGDRLVGFEDSMRGIQALIGAGVPPVLICPDVHPQLSDPLLNSIPHYTSFSEIPSAGPLRSLV